MKLHRILFYTLILSSFLIGRLNAQNKNVGINDTGNNPDPSAMLDVNSSTKGLLIPRVALISTSSNAPIGGSIAVSLLVYNTAKTADVTPGYYYWDGTKWRQVGSESGCVNLNDAYNCGGSGSGRIITANSGNVEINNGGLVVKYALSTPGSSIKVTNTTDGVSVNAENTSPSANYSTIQSITSSTKSTPTSAIAALAGVSQSKAFGVVGQILPNANGGETTAGVFGNNLKTNGGYGVYGSAVNGVWGEGTNIGVMGDGYTSTQGATSSGVVGTGYGNPSFGVVGQTSLDGQSVDPDGFGLYSQNNIIAAGDCYVGVDIISGSYVASVAGKEFRIDHPFDPANKYLRHFSIESNEVLNVYRGNVTLDNNGEATVNLPTYFSEINDKFSYNLTPIGDAAPDLHVKTKVNGNTFSIAGGKSGLEVSWTLYCERNDKLYRDNPDLRNVEIEKPAKFKGKYLRPELFGQPKEKSIFYIDNKNLNKSILKGITKKHDIKLNIDKSSGSRIED